MAREPAKRLPHVKALCPLTGMTFGTKVIDKHYCIATECKNGMIHIYCTHHLFKGFISHPQILEALHAENLKAQAHPA